MTSTHAVKNPAPLDLGHDKTELEVFLEPTCPYSKLAFGKLRPLLESVGEDALTIKIRFVSQPRHLCSGHRHAHHSRGEHMGRGFRGSPARLAADGLPLHFCSTLSAAGDLLDWIVTAPQ